MRLDVPFHMFVMLLRRSTAVPYSVVVVMMAGLLGSHKSLWLLSLHPHADEPTDDVRQFLKDYPKEYCVDNFRECDF